MDELNWRVCSHILWIYDYFTVFCCRLKTSAIIFQTCLCHIFIYMCPFAHHPILSSVVHFNGRTLAFILIRCWISLFFASFNVIVYIPTYMCTVTCIESMHTISWYTDEKTWITEKRISNYYFAHLHVSTWKLITTAIIILYWYAF